jgi:hypothetical protein
MNTFLSRSNSSLFSWSGVPASAPTAVLVRQVLGAIAHFEKGPPSLGSPPRGTLEERCVATVADVTATKRDCSHLKLFFEGETQMTTLDNLMKINGVMAAGEFSGD